MHTTMFFGLPSSQGYTTYLALFFNFNFVTSLWFTPRSRCFFSISQEILSVLNDAP